MLDRTTQHEAIMIVGKKKNAAEAPWKHGNPDRKISLNIPFPEPLHMQLDYLLEQRAIRSKSSFIREAVERAAEEEIQKLRHVQAALRQFEKKKPVQR